MLTEQLVRETLSSVKYPGFSRDIVSFGIIKAIKIEGTDVTVQMSLATNDPNVPQLIKAGISSTLIVGEAMGHCYHYMANLPEGRDALDAIIRFFWQNLK